MEEINQKYAEISELKALLSETDYMIIKAYETGYKVPDGVLTERANARTQINSIEDEIAELEKKLNK